MNQTEQKWIVPSVVKTILPGLQRTLALERETPEVQREMEMEPLALLSASSVSGGWSRIQPLPVIPADFSLNLRLFSTPRLPLSPNIPRAQFCLKWMCYSSHALLQRCNGIRGTRLPVGPPKPPSTESFQLLTAHGVIMAFWAFPQGSLGPWGILIKAALWVLEGNTGPELSVGACFEFWFSFCLASERLGWFMEQRKWSTCGPTVSVLKQKPLLSC